LYVHVTSYFFKACDQALVGPHTHGRGVSGRGKGRHDARQRNQGMSNRSNTMRQTDNTHSSINRTQQGRGRPFNRFDKSGSARKSGDCFRPPNKRKN
jgi:hypothetical protein